MARGDTPLVVAGGGGCAGLHNDGSDASTTESGSNGGQNLELTGATGGNGKFVEYGGAGFFTDNGGSGDTLARAFVHGGTGAVRSGSTGSTGGFGGGAAGRTSFTGGGGGGYSGGGDGEYAIVFAHLGIPSMSLLCCRHPLAIDSGTCCFRRCSGNYRSGGGGSFNSGANQSNRVGNEGPGVVIITCV